MDFLPLEIDGRRVYAGFWRRAAAALVDFLVFTFILIGDYFLSSISLPVAIVAGVASRVFFTAYSAYLHYRFGATLGKMAAGIKVTLPNGSKIGLKQAFLRSSVDMLFSLLGVVAYVLAISRVDASEFLSAGWLERSRYLTPFLPAWYGFVRTGFGVWGQSELIVLLFNSRKRALHDYIAGTVVIHRHYASASGRPTPSLATSPIGGANA